METITLQPDDDLAALRDRVRRVQERRFLLYLPWEARTLSRPLDYQLLWREASALGRQFAVVSPDPERRALARQMGFSAFSTVEQAAAAQRWRWPSPERPTPPPRAWWEEEPPLQPPPARRLPRWAHHTRHGMRATVFLAVLLVLLITAYTILPWADVTIIPAGEHLSIVVPVFASLSAETVDLEAHVIPASRPGDYFEGYLEVETTGTAAFVSGQATGTVVFTNLLAQEVVVPAHTVVRTSSASFPARFATTESVTIPPLGQAAAPIEALTSGPAGNVDVNQINYVEGPAGMALRVTNPEPTSGGATQDVRAVSQEDMDRARELLTAQLLEEAYQALQQPPYIQPTETLLRPTLTVQAAEVSFDRFIHERADRLGLHMRILVTGMAVDRDNAEAVAYAALSERLPPGYTLVGASFEMGEMAEEMSPEGDLTLFVTATGYAAARLDVETVQRLVQGCPRSQVADRLGAELPLAEPPQVTLWPERLPWMPLLPMRITVHIVPMG
jgi:hypothetical protein